MDDTGDTGKGRQTPENKLDTAHDEQTNKAYKIKHETKWATFVASISASYLICALVVLLWMLFDTWSGRNQLLDKLGYSKNLLTLETFRLMAYVAIGGALGATVDGIRSIISWHSEREAYGPRFIWKDLSLPFVGASVGIMVYVTIRGGVGVFNGDFSLDSAGGMPKLAAFAVSSLAGFSSWQVFRWIDSKANQLFSVVKDSTDSSDVQVVVPNLSGKTPDEALELLKPLNLVLGKTNHDAHAGTNLGKILKQNPAAGLVAASGSAVSITIGGKAA